MIPRKIQALNIKELSRQRTVPNAITFPMEHFIRATQEYTTAEKHIPAPYFRRVVQVKSGLVKAQLLINGLGIYYVFCNGKDITKGPFAPYRANPDHRVYFDCYDLTAQLKEGKNVLAFWLGVGLQSSVVPCWGWSVLPWRSAVQMAFSLELEYADGTKETIYSDPETKTADSPVIFDDFLAGEHYDARLELPGWNLPDYDDSAWRPSQAAPTPRGVPCLCQAEPIGRFEELEPVAVIPVEQGYVYDFGKNIAGACRLHINGQPGQKLIIDHFEWMDNGKPSFNCIFPRKDVWLNQDMYICRGGEESWMPRFIYHGFRYVLIQGLTPEQATPDLLRYVVMHSDMEKIGTFHCDNEIVNALQAATVNSDRANFFYFPTDCPHREKHGWTADASLSAEQMLYNMQPANSWKEWLRNIYRAMTPEGGLPGIIPTGGACYDWGNGPAWDSVIVELPYQAYRYRGDRQIVEEAVVPLMRYMTYLTTKRQENGLICFGLGDWCDVDAKELFCNTPLVVTDSIIAMDIARKAAFLFGVAGKPTFQKFAQELSDSLMADIRRELVDHEQLYVYGDTQSTQAMALYYGVFTEEEFDGAMAHLLELIAEKDDHFATGVLGGRVIFRLLAEHGYADLALKMIIREDAPSYGNIIKRGATSLWEEFNPEDPARGDQNHHFWGDISAWFYRYLGGIRPNPTGEDVNRLDVAPCFVSQLNQAQADYKMPAGAVQVAWKREGSQVQLQVQVPEKAKGSILLPEGWQFADGSNQCKLQSGQWTLIGAK